MTPQMLRRSRTTILPYPSRFVIPIRQPISPQWIASRTQLSRLYATVSSTTSISAHNARPSLPLHDTLEQLKPVLLALRNTGYGDISRVELALRGLEQGDSPSRIAVVSNNAAELLAPLFLEEVSRGEAIWIEELQEWIAAGKQYLGQGLLLRYGPSSKIISPAGSPLSILTAPVEVLKTNNFEIVIAAEIGRNPLVPIFRASTTRNARAIEYPVHRTVFYAGSGKEGIRRLIQTASAFQTQPDQTLRLISLPGGGGDDVGLPTFRVVDLNAGGTGLQWLKEWLLSGTVPEKGRVLKQLVRDLLRDVVWDAAMKVGEEDNAQPLPSPIFSSRGDSADTLARAITAWSKAAHKELHDSLQAMFSGKEWAKIEWWKLLWRVDDVGAVGKSIINKGFLRQSNEGATFLAGRMFGAGYSPPLPFAEDGRMLQNISEGRIDPHGAWWTVLRPSYIGQQREDIIRTLVPSLQSSANKYLLAALSFSGISWVFSVLLYMSEGSLYSASAVAAVGTMMSLRRLQKRWIKERKIFEKTVREKGREAIVGCERWSWEKMAENVRRDLPQDLDMKMKERESLRKALGDGMKLFNSNT